jgi:hypothetical protein
MSDTVALPRALFGNLPDEAVAVASGCHIHIPAELATNQQRDITFNARFARLPSGGELRSVHIHGPRIEIINIFHFPAPDRALPIYAMEFVVFGRRPVVGVIDAKALQPHPHATALWRETMQAAHARFPLLDRADDPPGWYEECRSGLDFFTRPKHDTGLDQLIACHAFVWSRLAAAFTAAPALSAEETAAHAATLADYKDHHRHNSPGLPFLHRTFGPDWTDRFLRTALFA